MADATIKARCDAVMAAVTGAVTVNWTNGSSKVAKAKGIVSGDFAYYQANQALAQQTNWDEFLAASCQ